MVCCSKGSSLQPLRNENMRCLGGEARSVGYRGEGEARAWECDMACEVDKQSLTTWCM